jgi:hypothetical protein
LQLLLLLVVLQQWLLLLMIWLPLFLLLQHLLRLALMLLLPLLRLPLMVSMLWVAIQILLVLQWTRDKRWGVHRYRRRYRPRPVKRCAAVRILCVQVLSHSLSSPSRIELSCSPLLLVSSPFSSLIFLSSFLIPSSLSYGRRVRPSHALPARSDTHLQLSGLPLL